MGLEHICGGPGGTSKGLGGVGRPSLRHGMGQEALFEAWDGSGSLLEIREDSGSLPMGFERDREALVEVQEAFRRFRKGREALPQV